MDLRFWHQPDVATLWRVRSEVAVAAKQALGAAGINIAFPQRVVRFVAGPEGAAPGPGRVGGQPLSRGARKTVSATPAYGPRPGAATPVRSWALAGRYGAASAGS